VANATDRVAKGIVTVTDTGRQRSAETLSAATRFYHHAFIGTDSTGYYCKGDDTQSWLFAGIVKGDQGNPLLPAGTAGDGTINLDILRPHSIETILTSVAVTDVGKPVYATFDNQVTLASSGTTYANVVGFVSEKVATNIALIELAYDGIAAHRRLMAAKWLAATGAQTLSKYDVGKKIFVPSTGAYTVTLPAVEDVPAGAELTFLKTTTDAVILTLDGADSEEIDAATTLTTIDAGYDCATLVNTGVRWIVLNRDIA
jgi:hypothetical protein